MIMDLKTFFHENPRAALGFSGGVDSSYLLYAGMQYGAEIKAYFVKTAFQPNFELEDAYHVAQQVGAEISVIEADVLSKTEVASNPPDRCYHCKKLIFGIIKESAQRDGFPLIIDGSNASDDEGDRAGMRALKELFVRSPLRECSLTKDDVRRLSKEAGLFTWEKPSYACLATRIPAGIRITLELLEKVERSEDALFSMGFSDFRVRILDGGAKIQLPEGQMGLALEKREDILGALKPHFDCVMLDLDAR